jgi:uncharacterized CHY-type Zn-finger protein
MLQELESSYEAEKKNAAKESDEANCTILCGVCLEIKSAEEAVKKGCSSDTCKAAWCKSCLDELKVSFVKELSCGDVKDPPVCPFCRKSLILSEMELSLMMRYL